MNEKTRRTSSDEVIRRVLRSCKPDVSAAPGSKERVLARLKGHLEARRRAPSLKIGRSQHVALLIAGGSALAVAAMICVALWFTLGGGVTPARGDFAEVLRRIRSARSVSYHLTVRMPGQPEDKAEVLASAGHVRVTWGDGKVQVFDEIQRKILTLSPASKEASLADRPNSGPYADLLQSLRNANDSAGKHVGREILDGKEAEVYQVTLAEGSLQMWVDPEGGLPSRVEYAGHGADGKNTVIVVSSFRWDLPVDETLFRLDVPTGYAMKRLDAEPIEADLVRLLRLCAEKANGRFPAKLDVPAVFGLIQGRSESDVRATIRVQDEMTYTHVQDQDRDVLRDCMGGLAFVQGVREAGTWEYVGGDVRFGDKNAEVCWWTSPGSSTRRVIYGDLRIADAPLASPSSQEQSDSSQPAPAE